MGCDIHIWTEVRKDGKWEISGYQPNGSRNYNTFAILANVRNGRGFAGIKTGEGFNPISDPKGVPDDASPEYLEAVDQWEGDGHSHSFLTMQELTSFDWGQFTMLRGSLSLSEYKVIRETGEKPTSYCGSVMGPRVITIDTAEADTLLDTGLYNGLSVDDASFYVNCHWPVMYSECCKGLNASMKAMESLGSPEDVRIVFFFDN